MRKLCLFLALMIFSGCAWVEQRPSPPPERKVSPAAAKTQYSAAQKAFQDKLAAAPGLTLAELQAKWGQVRQGLTYKSSTIYHWTRTITVTPPPEAAAELGLGSPEAAAQAPGDLVLSCMAVFIVQNEVVVEASSEGRCLDHNLMPAWQPAVRASSG